MRYPTDVKRLQAKPKSALAGMLVFTMLLLVVLSALWRPLPPWAGAPCAWIALLLLLPSLPVHQLRLSLCMFALGGGGLLWASWRGHIPQLAAIFSVNLELLALLTGVSFLRRITGPREVQGEGQAQGITSFRKSLLAIHLLSAIINISALAIMGRRLQRSGSLNRLQLLVLSRGFSSAAFWSPFFAAMAVALSYAPGSDLEHLILIGLPPAGIALLVTIIELRDDSNMRLFSGCSIRFEALWIPLSLSGIVLLSHHLLAGSNVLILIACAAPMLTATTLLRRRGRRTGRILLRHIRCALPHSGAELSLFLAAGIFASGISAMVESDLFSLQIESFGITQAALLLLLLILGALIGIHPVIGIATAGALLIPLQIEPNLLGALFLAGWALGVSLSPFSGTHLFLHSTFGAGIFSFPHWNWRYVLLMYLVFIAWLKLLWSQGVF